MKLRSLAPTAITGKKVLVRVDYNVPLKNGKVADDSRIRLSLETIRFLQQHRAKIVLLSHLGRPKGQVDPTLSLQPVALQLQELLAQPVIFAPDLETAQSQASGLMAGQVMLLENIRFWPGEKKNDPKFAHQLATLGETYINEAFSASHRAHASVSAITKHLPAYAGLNFSQEVEHLSQLMTKPKRPFIMVVGGKKISDKVGAVVNLAKVADCVLLGGGTANNFLKAEGFEVFKSIVEEGGESKEKRPINYVKLAEDLIESTKQNRLLLNNFIPLPKILYPIDVIAATNPDSHTTQTIDLVGETPPTTKNLMYLDIGPKTIRLYQEVIAQAQTIFWNGPMGVFEQPLFATGTKDIARSIAKSGATTVLGGGDTIAAINQFELTDHYDYVSAAGGAALEFLAGKELPGVLPLLAK